MNPERNAALRRAKSYPYKLPEKSFFYFRGEIKNLQEIEAKDPFSSQLQTPSGSEKIRDFLLSEGVEEQDLPEHFHAVLSVGSNAAPAQLARKFPIQPGKTDTAQPAEDFMLVLQAWLRDFDVVYSAHFSRYGAVPATLQRSTGTVVRLFVNFLTHKQLSVMHASEHLGENYVYAQLKNVWLDLEYDASLESVCFYRSIHDCLNLEGSPIAVAAIPAEKRRFAVHTEEEVLELAWQRLAPNEYETFDDFILSNVGECNAVRCERIQRLKRNALKFDGECEGFRYG